MTTSHVMKNVNSGKRLWTANSSSRCRLLRTLEMSIRSGDNKLHCMASIARSDAWRVNRCHLKLFSSPLLSNSNCQLCVIEKGRRKVKFDTNNKLCDQNIGEKRFIILLFHNISSNGTHSQIHADTENRRRYCPTTVLTHSRFRNFI